MSTTPNTPAAKRSKAYIFPIIGITLVLAVAGMLIAAISHLSKSGSSPTPSPTTETLPEIHLPRPALISSHPDLKWEQHLFPDGTSESYTTISQSGYIYVIGITQPASSASLPLIFVARLTLDGTLTHVNTLSSPLTTSIVSHTLSGNTIHLLTRRSSNGISGFDVVKLSLTDLSMKTYSNIGSPLSGENPRFIVDNGSHLYIISEVSRPAEYNHTLSIYKADYSLRQLNMSRSHRSAAINLLYARAAADSVTVIASARAGVSGYPTAYIYSTSSSDITWRNTVLPNTDITVLAVTSTPSGYLLAASDNSNRSAALSITLDLRLNHQLTHSQYVANTSSAAIYHQGNDALVSYTDTDGGSLNLYRRLNSEVLLRTPKGKLAAAAPLSAGGFLTAHTSGNYTTIYRVTQTQQLILTRTLTQQPTAIIITANGAIFTAHHDNSVCVYALA